MAKVKVNFHECIQDSQEYGSDDEHMVSRVFFSIEVDGKQWSDKLYHADLKQVVGGKFEKNPVEVGLPYDSSGQPYSGPMNYEAFRDGAESYFRNLVGSKGLGIHIEGGSHIRMQNNRFVHEDSIEFEAADTRPQW